MTFHCSTHTQARTRLVQDRRTWLDLDRQVYIQDNQVEEAYEATEEFFSYLLTYLTSI